ncbi:MAG: hypothetical protein Q7V58_01095 [Actinomycetota bacterium]|nr:hypothetical protein [Actinomycetota bacterium]
MTEAERSRAARAAAEAALVRVVHHYGARPEFVVLGGLVPELLCAGSDWRHAGTTDVDVQVDLEVAAGAVNAARLEQALMNAEFQPDSDRAWRWTAEGDSAPAIVKFELLTDLDDQPEGATVHFDGCERLGAANLRGTGFASRDIDVCTLSARVGGDWRTVEVNVTGIAGLLLAKVAVARARRAAKDWYDIAFVLLHNDLGGPRAASEAVRARFADDLHGPIRSALDDLRANFDSERDQGASAYAEQMRADNPGLDVPTFAGDAVIAVSSFYKFLTTPQEGAVA